MTDESALAQRCRRLLVALGLAGADTPLRVTPLSGGVASDIARVETPEATYAVKFALERLKVAEDWHAPVHRNRAEYAWLSFVSGILPRNAPRLYGRSGEEGGFVMEYLAGGSVRLWKTTLLREHPDRGEAAAVGALLGRIHHAATRRGFDARPFANADDFHALRLEPYLLFTATRHPALSARLTALAEALHRSRVTLVHGDVSPKNILFRGPDPILLDAECATMGDPGFDLAFCLNHLALKALHLPGSRARLLANIGDLWAAYRPHVTWEAPEALESRVAALIPALMLARVDGKSPVEYLGAGEQAAVRRIAAPLVAAPPATLAALAAGLGAAFGKV
ncbi:MAG: aminoglycoside phosphotransferase family protein [Rubellimicrobium sp.]|nr:aminoglycoside phosphotransferase family protein [Rubellimicrobium sp.]